MLRIHGVERLGGGEYRIAPEHIEVASFIGLAAVTGGDLWIDEAAPEDLVPILPHLARLGMRVEIDGTSVHVPPGPGPASAGRPRRPDPEDRRRPVARVPRRPDVDRARGRDAAKGTILIFEKMFENRALRRTLVGGARIILCDPHRAVVTGPAKLYGERMDSPDIRAGMAMLIASLCTEGTPTIGNVGQIDRGYERIDERLRALGAHIERVAD